jgi:hypothetical protein
MFTTTDIKTYEHFKSLGLEVELVEPTLLDICLKFAKQVAPRKDKYYLLGTKKTKEEIAFAISEFDSSLEFEIGDYHKCYMDNSFIIYLL